MKSVIRNILFSNLELSAYDPQYRRLLITNIGYIAGFLILVSFSINNYYHQNMEAALFEALQIPLVVYGFMRLRKNHNIDQAAALSGYLFFAGILGTTWLFHFHEYVASWAFFFPFIAMSLFPRPKSFYIVAIFNSAIYLMAFYFWYLGDISTVALSRFLSASVLFTILVYIYETTISNTLKEHERLQTSLQKSLDEIHHMAITDVLTELHNKRHFDKVLFEEFNRAKRMDKPFTLAIADVDNFKQYNDLYGHEAGDQALAKVGSVLREYTQRAGDFAFRIGGEEFALILQSDPECDKSRDLQAIVSAVEALAIPHKHNHPYHKITISIGGVCIDAYHDHSPVDLYNRADRNLYRVKAEGKNSYLLSKLNR